MTDAKPVFCIRQVDHADGRVFLAPSCVCVAREFCSSLHRQRHRRQLLQAADLTPGRSPQRRRQGPALLTRKQASIALVGMLNPFGRDACGALPGRVTSSSFILERQRHSRPVFNDLAAIDLHVELADFGDTQITQRLGGSFHSIFRRILMRNN